MRRLPHFRSAKAPGLAAGIQRALFGVAHATAACGGRNGRALGVPDGLEAILDICSVDHDNGFMPRRSTPAGESIPVGAAEIAARLGVRPQTVHTWRHRKLMPQPRWTVSGQPAWDWAEIEAWARRTGRLREGDTHAALLELEGVGWEGDLDEMRSHRARRR